jgi:aminoglycoside 6'-N-acetyltransferase
MPIGYIQIYNAYDFARSKPLEGLPLKLGAFDIFIGEEICLKRGIGARVIVQFFKNHGDAYTHIFADPSIENITAIRAYEKAGLKKIEEQLDTGEVWMIREI